MLPPAPGQAVACPAFLSTRRSSYSAGETVDAALNFSPTSPAFAAGLFIQPHPSRACWRWTCRVDYSFAPAARASASRARFSHSAAISTRCFLSKPSALAASARHRSACRRYSETSSTETFPSSRYALPSCKRSRLAARRIRTGMQRFCVSRAITGISPRCSDLTVRPSAPEPWLA